MKEAPSGPWPEIELTDATGACRILGGSRPIHRGSLYRGVKLGVYPEPIRLGPGTSRWVVAELNEALRARMRDRRGAA